MTFRPGERMDQTRLALLLEGLTEPAPDDLLPLLAEVAELRMGLRDLHEHLSPTVAWRGWERGPPSRGGPP